MEDTAKFTLEDLTFWKVRKMLKDHKSWKVEGHGRALHVSGLNVYPEYGGIRFRVDSEVVYEPNILGWLCFHFPTRRLRVYLSKVEQED